MTELYEILEVDVTATATEIRKSYRRLALRYHPDKMAGALEQELADAEVKFKQISHAYEVLSDESARREYDTYGTTGSNGNYPEYDYGANPFEQFYGGHDFSGDDFYSFFGGMPNGHQPPPQRTKRTEDAVIDVDVTLEQLFIGKTVKFTRLRNVICSHCTGTGAKKHAVAKPCVQCEGKGHYLKFRRVGPGMVAQEAVQCKLCRGEGKIFRPKDKCKRCNGSKVVDETKIMEFEIAPGSRDGERVVLEHQLDEYPGKETGDIVIVVHCERHLRFKRMGDDLYTQFKVPLVDALCGFSENIATHLDGRTIKLTTPVGKVIRPGDFVKIKGEGMPHKKKLWFSTLGRGDLYIEMLVEFPSDHWYLEKGDLDKMRNLLPQKLALKADSQRQLVDPELLEDANIDEYTDFVISRREALPSYEEGENKAGAGTERPECTTQ